MHRLVLSAVLIVTTLAPLAPSRSQSLDYLLGPGSDVGHSTQVEPVNCRQNADGSETCDTKLINPPGDTQARPQFSPFPN